MDRVTWAKMKAIMLIATIGFLAGCEEAPGYPIATGPQVGRETITFFYTFSVSNANPESTTTVSLFKGNALVASVRVVGSTPRSVLTTAAVAFPVREVDLPSSLVASSSSFVSTSTIIDYNKMLIFHITVSDNNIVLVQE